MTSSGASALTFTNGWSGGSPYKDLAIAITGNFTANSTVNLGDNIQPTTRDSSAIQSFTVSGTTFLNAGAVINFSAVDGSPDFSGPGTVNLGSLNIDGGTLNLTVGTNGNGTRPAQENQLGVTNIQGSTGTIKAGKDATLANLTINGTVSGSYAGTIANGATDAVVRVTKAGSNTQTLSGINTYTGTTSVTGGTLIISGAGSINSTAIVAVSGSTSTFRYDSTTGLTRNVTVASNGTFRYNSASAYTGTFTWTNGSLGGTNWGGNLGGLTVNAGRVITPGNSVGTATTTSQTWGPAGTYQFEVQDATAGAGTGWDLLTLSGDLTLSATEGDPFVIALTSLNGGGTSGDALNFLSDSNYSWLIADAGNAIGGFSSSLFFVDTASFTNPFTGNFSVVLGDSVIGGDNTQLYLQYTVPEPSSLSMAAMAFLVLLGGSKLYRYRKTHR